MSYRNFLDELKKGMPSPLYILSSADPFLHSEAVSLLKGLVPAGEREFSFEVFDVLNLNSVTFDQILDVLNTVPFFSGRKFVVIENIHKLLKKDILKLRPYFAGPSEGSVLVMLHAGPVKKDFREPGVKQIVLDVGAKELPSWLKAKAKSKGLEMPDAAVDYLIGTIGPDLGLLSSEIEKCTLIGKAVIDRKDIAEIIEGKRKYGIFDLVNAIRSRDADRVFRIYRVLRETEEPYALLGAINWQYSRLLSGKNKPEDREYLYRVFSILNSADVAIKSSGDSYPVELLLARLVRL
ncbi:MAG: DNA polymerase III subunit delta [Candidatus Sulfobium sp.]|jgi:DNA polymerase III delta subunit